jgi:hypothetical protein
MRGDKVLARAFGQKPLERVVWDIEGEKVFICRPDLLEACERRESWPVGFPVADIFQFDASLYKRLESAMRRKDTRNLSSIWTEAKPYIE